MSLKSMTMCAVLYSLALTPVILRAQDLGSISFPNSGADAAQTHFLRGVLLLHSFEYADAADAFRKAQIDDPTFALAYWGEALTHSHLLWGQQDLAEGRSILSRLAATREGRRARTKTERERAYLEAVEELFGDHADRMDRQRAYRDAMQRVHVRYPDDLEAAAFYAVSILGAATDRDHVEYMKAAGIAEQVFAANPLHPGAVHYLIHAYDDPVHVPLGLRPAHVYSRIAPAAAHALHMPSHIFVAAGLWDEVVSSNRASWKSSVERVNRKDLGVDEKGFHALLWLHYGLTQVGDFQEAEDVLKQMKADASASHSRRTRSHLAEMIAHHIIETEEWEGGEAFGADVDVSDLGITTFAGYHYAIGHAALKRGDVDRAGDAVNLILERLDRETGDDNGRKAAGVMASELVALIDLKHGDEATAMETLNDATNVEASIPYSYGPPDIVKPSAELLGEVLLGQGDFAGALKAFDRALARAPGRRLSERGLAAARTQAGDEDP